jgi:hypothetical protein
MEHAGQKVLFADTRVDKDIRQIIRLAVGTCHLPHLPNFMSLHSTLL